MSAFTDRISTAEPLDYVTPSFPSLYWPFPVNGNQAYFLYRTSDVWRFTLYWTLITYASLHLSTSGYAVIVQWRNWKVIWIAPLIYAIAGGVEAVIAGSIVGGLYDIRSSSSTGDWSD